MQKIPLLGYCLCCTEPCGGCQLCLYLPHFFPVTLDPTCYPQQANPRAQRPHMDSGCERGGERAGIEGSPPLEVE